MTQTSAKHIAVIMDGNGRWAISQNKPRSAGHKAGVSKTKDIIRSAAEHGVKTLSLFTFSSENRFRPVSEVVALMKLLAESLRDGVDELAENGIRLKFIGDLSFFDRQLQELMCESEKRTAEQTAMDLKVAVNYSGRWDIASAVRKIHESNPALPEDNQALEDLITRHLQTADVDLLIRTGNESRISNFFLWQAAYAEIYFSPTLWPDFSTREFETILDWYAHRQRRFGLTSEQKNDKH